MNERINLRHYYELDATKLFEKDYYNFLLKAEKNEARYKHLEGSYIDPDSVDDVEKSSFYNHLTCFLNHQENCREKEQKYFFVPPREAPLTKQEKEYNKDEKKITVIQGNKELFRLTSDQFGFSAAETIYDSNKSPLAKLLHLSQKENQEKQKQIKDLITQYVKNTRTIGGSFVWPVQPQGRRDCYYNIQRGRYLEDRVDLTLLEIKYALDGRPDNKEYTSDILYNHQDKNKYMKTWLEHFGTFKKYVEYFMLEPFVKDDMPINIIDGEPLHEDYIIEYRKKYNRQHIQTLTAKEICDMLERLERMILKRSEKMENVIKPYYEENNG